MLTEINKYARQYVFFLSRGILGIEEQLNLCRHSLKSQGIHQQLLEEHGHMYIRFPFQETSTIALLI